MTMSNKKKKGVLNRKTNFKKKKKKNNRHKKQTAKQKAGKIYQKLANGAANCAPLTKKPKQNFVAKSKSFFSRCAHTTSQCKKFLHSQMQKVFHEPTYRMTVHKFFTLAPRKMRGKRRIFTLQ